jgi:tetratricopeptide (TPR) repeat protein
LENLGLNGWKTKFESYIAAAQDNLVYVGAGLGLVIAIAGAGYWYHSSSMNKEQAATTILADCLSQYEQAEQGKAQWADVVTMAHAGYEKFSKTNVAPYILAIEIDALLAQEKNNEALEKLDLMVSKMGTSSPLYTLYKLKQILIKLDIPEMKEAAFKELQQLSQAPTNNFSDEVLYYTGLYYQNAGEHEKAIQTWKPLIALNNTVSDQIARSPWATLAEAKMNGLA